MVESNMLIGVKRPGNKVFRPQEMQHRFGAKADFIRYFREQRKFIAANCNVLYSSTLRTA